MASRRAQAAANKNRRIKMRKRGKLDMKQIMKERANDKGPGLSTDHVLRLEHSKISPDVVKVISVPVTRVDPAYTKANARAAAHRQLKLMDHVESISGHGYRTRSDNRLLRNKDGHIFVIRDKLDEYLAVAFGGKKMSEEELLKVGQPNEEGWRSTNPYPLAEVKQKLEKMRDGIEKWNHFVVENLPSYRLDLFFSPKKDAWFYVCLNPETGESKRTLVYPSKAYAELRRQTETWSWRMLSIPTIKL